MELRHIRYFLAVAQELNFNRAARKLNMAQPPLSQQIKALEQELGVLLFDRDRRHVALSTAGSAFYPRAVAIMEMVQTAVEEARASQHRLVGQLNVAISPIASYTLLPAIIRDFQLRAPEARLNLIDLRINEQDDALRTARVDVCFLYPILGNDSLEWEQLLMESGAVALPRGHKLARRKCISLRDLAAERWLMFQPAYAPLIAEAFHRACTNAGFTPVIANHIDSLEGRLQMVAAGAGIAIMPAAMETIPRPGVRFVRLREDELRLPVGLLWRKGNCTALLDLFLDCSRRAAAALEPVVDVCAD